MAYHKPIIMELIDLAKQIKEAEKRGESTGLSPDELAFCDDLAVMGDEILKGMQNA